MASILCVDDEPSALLVLRETLTAAGHRVVAVKNVSAAFSVLERGDIDLIISDYRMPEATGLEFLSRLAEAELEVPLIMATGYATVEHAVASIKAGAVDYIMKPFRPQQLELVVEQALEFVRLRRENAQLRDEVTQLRGDRQIIGESEALQRVMQVVHAVAPTRATVLLQGESGTGKELLARALHAASDRRDGPFVSINAAALPEQLVESVLFGHEKGAFTGAIKQVKGAFERAHRGTLLLDEISEMRLDLQAKLLRVLQEQEFERVGGTSPIRVDVRVIATTNLDLSAKVASGGFREDLFYRLSVVPIRVPPLRERADDIPTLANFFAQRSATEMGKRITGLDPSALELLQQHDWPGNVRELAHTIERAVIMSPGPVLQARSFDLKAQGILGALSTAPSAPRAGAAEASHAYTYAAPADADGPNGALPPGAIVLDTLNLAEAEARLIEKALEATGNNRTRAADLLGISVRTLRNKLNRPD